MLDTLRGFASTWLGKILGAFLLIGLAGFGISNVLTSLGSNTVARVGGEEISSIDFQRAYNTQLNNAAQQTGSVPSAQQAVAMGLPSAALNQLANDAALNQIGRSYGLGVSDAQLGRQLRQDPNFAGTLGRFDPEAFRQVLQQNGLTESQYYDTLRKSARREQLGVSLFRDAPVPATAAELFARYSADLRTLDYFVLSAATMLPPEEPTEEELAAYLQENQAEYRTVPTREVSLMVLSPDVLAEGMEVGPDEIAEEYERTQASYQTPERREIEQVSLNSDELVAAFEAGKAEGKSFEDLVAEDNLTPSSLGERARSQLTDEALAEAVFAMDEGDFEILPAVTGQRAVYVKSVTPEAQQSLEEASDAIAERLKLRKARDSFIDVLDQIEELRAAFRPLTEIAERFELPLQSIEVSQTGAELSQVEALQPDDSSKVASAIFSAEQGELAPTVTLSTTRNAWFDIEAVNPERDQTLDEVRELVSQAITDERLASQLQDEAAAVVGRLEAGEAFEDVAISRNLFPEVSQPVSRSGAGPVIDRNVAQAAYEGGEGYVGSAVNGDGDHVIFQVSSIQPAADNVLANAAQFVNSSMIDSLYSAYVTGLREDAGMTINQGVLSQILALDGSN